MESGEKKRKAGEENGKSYFLNLKNYGRNKKAEVNEGRKTQNIIRLAT